MSIDAETWLENAAASAARRIALPAEERWIPQAKIERPSWWFSAVAVATLVLAIILSVRTTMAPSQVVSGAPAPYAQTPADADGWRRIRAATPAWVPVMRPTLLPPRVVTSDERCGQPTVDAVPSGDWGHGYSGETGWVMEYRHESGFASCPAVVVVLSVQLDKGVPVLGNARGMRSTETLVRTVTVRGVPADIRTVAPYGDIAVVFQEGSFVYRISASGVAADDLVRVAQSLEEVER